MAHPHRKWTRRETLVGLTRLAGGTLWAGSGARTLVEAAAYRPQLSAQIYVWVQHLQSQQRSLAEGMEQALESMARAGFRRVELMADFFSPALREKTLARLRKARLQMPSIYANMTLHEESAAEKSLTETLQLAEVVRRAGARWILTNPSPKPHAARKSDEELATQALYLDRIGLRLRSQGMRLMVHHHTPELAEGAREWRHQLQHTDPKLVSCCVDVDWAVRGGQDPLAFLEEAGARLVSLHVRNSHQGVWMEDFGEGDIDYRKVADYLRRIRFRGYLVVELAYDERTRVTRSLEENLRRSRVYAAKVFALESRT
jgi:inosose dehydratase